MKTVKEYIIMTFAMAEIAAGVYFFLIPSNTAISSIAALAIMASKVTPWSVSMITMVMNVALLIVGLLLCGKDFGAKTIYTSIIFPIFLGILEKAFPDFTSFTNDRTLDMVAYIFVICFGQSILFNINASSGGLDVVGKVMNKYFQVEIGSAIAGVGIIIAGLSVFVYDTKSVVMSFIGTYVSGLVLDHFIFDQSLKRKVCIISKKEEEIKSFILNNMGSGASIYMPVGAYTMQAHPEIDVLVTKHEYQQLMNYLAKEDPDAFITIYKVSDIRYRPKPSAAHK